MRVTALIENGLADGCDGLIPEFGLSLHFERDGLQVLFDTGASGMFVDNARTLGIDLAEIDVAVISHHHFDHGGGLARFLEVNDQATIYLRDCADRGHTFRAFGLIKRPIGIDYETIDRNPERFKQIAGSVEIEPGIFLLTRIGDAHVRPKGNRHLFVERDGEPVEDPLDHELVMVVHEPDGLVVFSGCSHSGILNMVDTAIEHFPGNQVKAVFGGFHLIGIPLFNTMAARRHDVLEIGRQMAERVQGTVFSGHCTGMKAFGLLKNSMGDRLQSLATGSSIEI